MVDLKKEAMKKENIFYLVFILTVLAIRISVILVPETDIMFMDVVVHHFWFGVILIGTGLILSALGFVLPGKEFWQKVILFGVGLGLLVDQITFILLEKGKDAEYWSQPSIIGVIVVACLFYPIRKTITHFLFV